MTKRTIKAGDGYRLYDLGIEGGSVYLDLTDCDFAVYAASGRSGVTVRLSEDMATRLGLIGCMAKGRT